MPASPKLRAWLQLVRPPNLFTVPGDPLAGYFLASCMGESSVFQAKSALLTALAALLLYMGGLIGNDVADMEEDRRDRPTRPIPSGQVSRFAAVVASALCAELGLCAAYYAGWPAFVMACLTQLAIMLYNGGLKKYAIRGALTMGACRGLSFMMGAAAAPSLDFEGAFVFVLVASICVTFYIAGVTWIADRETVEERIGFRRWIPACAMLVCFLPGCALVLIGFVTDWFIDLPTSLFLLLALTAIGWAFLIGRRLSGIPPKNVLGASIGGLIRGLLLVQAAFAVLGGTVGLITAAVLLAFWPISKAVSRWFYAT
jgi:4-hydroxybenzoate polyprenyltransferase